MTLFMLQIETLIFRLAQHFNERHKMRGIDISHWDTIDTLNFNYIDFIICKATEGIGYTDETFFMNVSSVQANKKLLGFYHFARENEPEKEAEYFYSIVKPYICTGIPVLDYETKNINDKSWVERFMKRFHELSGIWAMLYVSASLTDTFMDSWLADVCPLWVAGYPYHMYDWPTDGMPYDISPWNFAAIWQFSSELELCGQKYDGNIAYINANTWNAIATGGNAKPEPTQKTTDDLAKEVLLGEYGTGEDRKRMLGARYNEVQNRINELYRIADEVINGNWGNGSTRKQRLEQSGYPYDIVQGIVNSILM